MKEASTRTSVALTIGLALLPFAATCAVHGQKIAPHMIAVKKGDGTFGKPILRHPKGLVTVKPGELFDDSGKRLAVLNRSGSVACWTFSPDGRFLAVGIKYDSYNTSRPKDSGTIRGYLHLYDAATGKMLLDLTEGNIGPVTDVTFSKDGKALHYRSGEYREIGGK